MEEYRGYKIGDRVEIDPIVVTHLTFLKRLRIVKFEYDFVYDNTIVVLTNGRETESFLADAVLPIKEEPINISVGILAGMDAPSCEYPIHSTLTNDDISPAIIAQLRG